MANRKKFTNNGTSTLLSNFNIGATTCSVQAGHGTRFDSPGASEEFRFTLKDAAGNIEICKCTQRTVDTFNVVVRAQEGTTERNWLAGDLVEARITKETLESFPQPEADNIFNVKDNKYGAKGDGVTNDTTAITNAINAANAADTGTTAATLVFPDGVYLVTPATLPTINCNVYGPGAMIKSATNADTYVLSFDDMAYGRAVDLYAVVGPNFGTTWQTAANQHGIGIQVLRAEHSRFRFQKLEGLYAVADFAGHINEQHIGECVFQAHSIMHNNFGINLNAGDSQCEANRFEIGYFNNNLTSVLLRNHGGMAASQCANNHFDILVMEFPAAGGTGFDLGGDVPAQTLANTFIIRENIAPNGTATVIQGNASATLGCNYFRFSDFDFAKIAVASPQIYDGAMEHNHPGDTAFKARSLTWGSAPPSGPSTYWQKGSIRLNNDPAVGEATGWRCITAGAPGTWDAIHGDPSVLQTWQNVTGSRAIGGGPYTNSTGMPIFVHASGSSSLGNGQNGYWEFLIDGTIYARSGQISAAANGGSDPAAFFMEVPAGSTYQINGLGNTPPALSIWSERR